MTTTDTSDLLEQMAEMARDVYCREMRAHVSRTRGLASDYGLKPIPLWDGGEDTDGKQHKPIWPVLARFAVDHRFDLGRLVRCMFRAYTAQPPTPRQCCLPMAATMYRQYGDQTWVEDVLTENRRLSNQMQQFQSSVLRSAGLKVQLGWTDRDVLCSVLADTTSSLTPLFRFTVADRSGYMSLAEACYAAALRQYLTQPGLYREAWKDFLPTAITSAGVQCHSVDRSGTASTRERETPPCRHDAMPARARRKPPSSPPGSRFRRRTY